jgi:hypothetical protein
MTESLLKPDSNAKLAAGIEELVDAEAGNIDRRIFWYESIYNLEL